MESWNRILLTYNSWNVNGWDIFCWVTGYVLIGFILAKISWYVRLVKYRIAKEAGKSAFLKSRNIGNNSVPVHLRSEWQKYFTENCLDVEPELYTPCLPFFWPVLVIALVIYWPIVWPIIKIMEVFSGMNDWIRDRALKGFNDELPTEADREEARAKIHQEALDSVKKTIGPNGKD